MLGGSSPSLKGDEMNGADVRMSGACSVTSGTELAGGRLEKIAEAWEGFTAGEDIVDGVRPEILTSWYRCREEYGVDPRLDRAPPATPDESAHPIERDVVFTELGGLATSAAREISGLDGLVTVTDPGGRILASWGSQRLLGHGADTNLAPWFTWSEWASGTNGMGTALECHHPLMVRGPEHWCRAFHPWVCAGVAVRDVITDDPLGVLTISCWETPLPDAVLPWLRDAASATEAKLRQRARHTGVLLAAAFADARVPPATPLAAVDPAGKVVLANAEAAALLGTPADVPAYAPTHRWTSQLPTLPQLVRRAVERARQDPHWVGSTQIFVPFLAAPVPFSARPVSAGTQVIGLLLAFGSPDGNPPFGGRRDDSLSGAPQPRALSALSALSALPSRVVGMREDRWVMLDPREIRFAEADRNNVWLKTDQGSLRSATRGLDRLEQQLRGKGFLRVHRRFLVNLSRIREIEPGFKGTLFLTTDTHTHETVPVARRHVAHLHQALGL
jgi:sigma-54 dependent transcriptional regulator, acetoin dehydrogenase operon transcriptional activator AcoR